MTTQLQGRFCTYPQGLASLLPQLLSLMACFSCLAAFPVFRYSERFGCIEYSISSSSSYSHNCFSLILNSESYWDVSEEQKGWAGAIQAAAVFGIFAAIAGFLSFGLLVAATCFELSPRRLVVAGVLLIMSAVFSLLTLVFGATDVCKYNGRTPENCTRQGFRAEEGAVFMIFAFFLYTAAGTSAFIFRRDVVREKAKLSKGETVGLTATQVTSYPPGASIPTGAPAPPPSFPGGGSAPSPQLGTTTRILPDGRVEKTYVDENGNAVREITSTSGPSVDV